MLELIIMKKRIVFFIKSFNDFDNILPIIHFFNKNYSEHTINIFSLVKDMKNFSDHTDYCVNNLNTHVYYNCRWAN